MGECPRNALNENNSGDKKFLDRLIVNPVLDKQPDIYIDIRIPNEFQQYGKINIGITAGIETDAVSAKWLEGCNRMNLVIVPSNHSKKGFLNPVYDKVQQTPDGKQEKIGELKLSVPMEVVFEGSDEDVYKPLKVDEIDTDFFDMLNEKVPEQFAFLSVGLWGKGGFGEDRKDLGKTVKLFYEAFANKKKQPALIMKTSGATCSVLDKEDILFRMNQIKTMFPADWKLPNVYLLHGELSDIEMNYLYNHPKVKCMVSLTHGEGYGRPLQEATMVGLPVIASNWSGHVDFLDTDNTMLLPGSLKKIPKSVVWKDILIPESSWFVVDESQVYKALVYSFENEYEIKNKAKTVMMKNRDKFTLKKMSEVLIKILEDLSKNLSVQVPLSLPKLKKVDKKSNEIKLPRLKKVTKNEEVTV